MAKRKTISKGLRFKIFKRDGFTCQYCGAQPPDAVLEIDHIHPVCEGGTNDEMNLLTSCAACNRGKGKKVIDNPQRPDADLAWLEMQQEVAELRRYAEAKQERDRWIAAIVQQLQATWMELSGKDWYPTERVMASMLHKYSAEIVEEAIITVALKVAGNYFGNKKNSWLPYTWGVLRNMAKQADADS